MRLIIIQQPYLTRLSTKPTLELTSAGALVVVVVVVVFLACFPPNCRFVVDAFSLPYVAVPGLGGLFAVTGLELGFADPAVLGLVVVFGLVVGLAVLGLGLEGLAVPLALDGPAAEKKFSSHNF